MLFVFFLYGVLDYNICAADHNCVTDYFSIKNENTVANNRIKNHDVIMYKTIVHESKMYLLSSQEQAEYNLLKQKPIDQITDYAIDNRYFCFRLEDDDTYNFCALSQLFGRKINYDSADVFLSNEEISDFKSYLKTMMENDVGKELVCVLLAKMRGRMHFVDTIKQMIDCNGLDDINKYKKLYLLYIMMQRDEDELNNIVAQKQTRIESAIKKKKYFKQMLFGLACAKRNDSVELNLANEDFTCFFKKFQNDKVFIVE